MVENNVIFKRVILKCVILGVQIKFEINMFIRFYKFPTVSACYVYNNTTNHMAKCIFLYSNTYIFNINFIY